jgi:hypothetical protein
MKHRPISSISRVRRSYYKSPEEEALMKGKALAVAILAVIILSAPFALAEKGSRKNHGYDHKYNEYGYGQLSCDGVYGLPPGLAKRSQLPPGLQRHLWKHGSLPPGLQKKIGPAYTMPYRGYSPYRERIAAPYYYAPRRSRIHISLDF